MTKAETLAKRDENLINDFQKDVTINKYKLDEECLSHSARFAYYAEVCAVAKTEVSRAKDRLDLIEAEQREAIRIRMEKDGIKPTIPMLDSATIRDEKVIKAKAELREAEEVYNRLQVAVQAMDSRRSELDNLVKLYVAGYFSTVDGAGKKSINEQTSSDVRKNLNR